MHFTDEERNALTDPRYDKTSIVYNSADIKSDIGARPGQYIQGRIIYSNKSNKILKDHETTHAARIEIKDSKTREYFIPVYDELDVVGDTRKYLKQLKGTYHTTGYDKSITDKNGYLSGEIDKKTSELIGPVPEKNYEEMQDLMETCTETIAGMINEPDEKEFETFSIPTSKMSAITYNKHMRNLLIMAIGSDEFITDMLGRDTEKALEKLNNRMQEYKKGATIEQYLQISDKYARAIGAILRAGYRGEPATKEMLDNKDIFEQQLEEYATDMFLSRMEKCNDIDKEEQIEYYESILENEQVKNKVKEFSKGKENTNLTLAKQDIIPIAKKDEVVMEKENATDVISQLERDTELEKDNDSHTLY